MNHRRQVAVFLKVDVIKIIVGLVVPGLDVKMQIIQKCGVIQQQLVFHRIMVMYIAKSILNVIIAGLVLVLAVFEFKKSYLIIKKVSINNNLHYHSLLVQILGLQISKNNFILYLKDTVLFKYD